MDQAANRPTKKQRELLTFIGTFIAGNGYGPSYREIMRGMGYKSVATVALHVDGLIVKGLLRKKDKSARSLELVGSDSAVFSTNKVKPAQEKWFIELISRKFEQAETMRPVSLVAVDELYVLVGALSILGFDSAANSFKLRLADLKKRLA